MELLVRAFQVLPGKEQDMHRFVATVRGERAADIADFYRRMGVERESWHVQETPHGTWVIGVTHFDAQTVEAAGREYSASQHPFDRWFKDQVKSFTGVDPDAAPLGPPTTCVFDTHSLQP